MHPRGLPPSSMNPAAQVPHKVPNPYNWQSAGHQAQTAPVPQPAPAITTLTKFDENRIDSMAIPRPANHIQNEQLTQPGGKRVPPDYGGPVFPSQTICTYVEEVDATPRYIKQSLSLVPQTKYLLNNGKIPFSLVITPFPNIERRECPVPKVDLSPYSPVFNSAQGGQVAAPQWSFSKEELPKRPGPLRCPFCGAYGNGFFQFAIRGASCNICEQTFDMPEWYASLLDEHRRQVPHEAAFREALNSCDDLGEGLPRLEHPFLRTELLKGTVDYLTHSHFLHSMPPGVTAIPKPNYALGAGCDDGRSPPLSVPCLVYVIDVTPPSVQANLPGTILNTLKYLVRAWPKGVLLDFCCILAADQVYTVSYNPASRKLVGMHVVSDTEHPFLPGSASKFLVRACCGPDCSDLDAYVDALVDLLLRCANDFAASAVATAAAVAVGIDLIDSRNKLDLTNTSYERNSSTLPSNATTHSSMPSHRLECMDSPRIYGRGGIIQLFTTGRPTVGICKVPESPAVIKSREDAAAKANKLKWPGGKDWTVFEPHPSINSDVGDIIKKAVLASASITVYAFDTRAQDEDTSKMSLGLYYAIIRQTGGQLYYYPMYNNQYDYEKVYYDMRSDIGAGIAMDVSFKLRLSKGLKAVKIKCPWSCVTSDNGGYGPDVNAFTIPRLHSHILLCFDLDFTMDELPGKCVYAQAAFSYTDLYGRRCLRVINKRYLTTSTLNCVFRMSDMEVALVSIIRDVLTSMMVGTKTAQKIREETDKRLTDLLLAYRLHAALSSPYGQLILPEAFKMLPIYITSLFKTSCTRTTGLMADVRVASMVQLMNAPLTVMLKSLYPLLYPLHRSIQPVKGEELERVGFSTDVRDELTGEVYYFVPATVATSGERVHSDSVYILDDGQSFIVYVGADVRPDIAELLLGAPRNQIANYPKLLLPRCTAAEQQDASNFLRRVWCTIAQLRVENNSPIYQPVKVILAGSVAESEFIWKMAEDRLSAEKGYVDYLVDMGKKYVMGFLGQEWVARSLGKYVSYEKEYIKHQHSGEHNMPDPAVHENVLTGLPHSYSASQPKNVYENVVIRSKLVHASVDKVIWSKLDDGPCITVAGGVRISILGYTLSNASSWLSGSLVLLWIKWMLVAMIMWLFVHIIFTLFSFVLKVEDTDVVVSYGKFSAQLFLKRESLILSLERPTMDLQITSGIQVTVSSEGMEQLYVDIAEGLKLTFDHKSMNCLMDVFSVVKLRLPDQVTSTSSSMDLINFAVLPKSYNLGPLHVKVKLPEVNVVLYDSTLLVGTDVVLDMNSNGMSVQVDAVSYESPKVLSKINRIRLLAKAASIIPSSRGLIELDDMEVLKRVNNENLVTLIVKALRISLDADATIRVELRSASRLNINWWLTQLWSVQDMYAADGPHVKLHFTVADFIGVRILPKDSQSFRVEAAGREDVVIRKVQLQKDHDQIKIKWKSVETITTTESRWLNASFGTGDLFLQNSPFALEVNIEGEDNKLFINQSVLSGWLGSESISDRLTPVGANVSGMYVAYGTSHLVLKARQITLVTPNFTSLTDFIGECLEKHSASSVGSSLIRDDIRYDTAIDLIRITVPWDTTMELEAQGVTLLQQEFKCDESQMQLVTNDGKTFQVWKVLDLSYVESLHVICESFYLCLSDMVYTIIDKYCLFLYDQYISWIPIDAQWIRRSSIDEETHPFVTAKPIAPILRCANLQVSVIGTAGISTAFRVSVDIDQNQLKQRHFTLDMFIAAVCTNRSIVIPELDDIRAVTKMIRSPSQETKSSYKSRFTTTAADDADITDFDPQSLIKPYGTIFTRRADSLDREGWTVAPLLEYPVELQLSKEDHNTWFMTNSADILLNFTVDDWPLLQEIYLTCKRWQALYSKISSHSSPTHLNSAVQYVAKFALSIRLTESTGLDTIFRVHTSPELPMTATLILGHMHRPYGDDLSSCGSDVSHHCQDFFKLHCPSHVHAQAVTAADVDIGPFSITASHWHQEKNQPLAEPQYINYAESRSMSVASSTVCHITTTGDSSPQFSLLDYLLNGISIRASITCINIDLPTPKETMKAFSAISEDPAVIATLAGEDDPDWPTEGEPAQSSSPFGAKTYEMDWTYPSITNLRPMDARVWRNVWGDPSEYVWVWEHKDPATEPRKWYIHKNYISRAIPPGASLMKLWDRGYAFVHNRTLVNKTDQTFVIMTEWKNLLNERINKVTFLQAGERYTLEENTNSKLTIVSAYTHVRAFDLNRLGNHAVPVNFAKNAGSHGASTVRQVIIHPYWKKYEGMETPILSIRIEPIIKIINHLPFGIKLSDRQTEFTVPPHSVGRVCSKGDVFLVLNDQKICLSTNNTVINFGSYGTCVVKVRRAHESGMIIIRLMCRLAIYNKAVGAAGCASVDLVKFYNNDYRIIQKLKIDNVLSSIETPYPCLFTHLLVAHVKIGNSPTFITVNQDLQNISSSGFEGANEHESPCDDVQIGNHSWVKIQHTPPSKYSSLSLHILPFITFTTDSQFKGTISLYNRQHLQSLPSEELPTQLAICQLKSNNSIGICLKPQSLLITDSNGGVTTSVTHLNKKRTAIVFSHRIAIHKEPNDTQSIPKAVYKKCRTLIAKRNNLDQFLLSESLTPSLQDENGSTGVLLLNKSKLAICAVEKPLGIGHVVPADGHWTHFDSFKFGLYTVSEENLSFRKLIAEYNVAPDDDLQPFEDIIQVHKITPTYFMPAKRLMSAGVIKSLSGGTRILIRVIWTRTDAVQVIVENFRRQQPYLESKLDISIKHALNIRIAAYKMLINNPKFLYTSISQHTFQGKFQFIPNFWLKHNNEKLMSIERPPKALTFSNTPEALSNSPSLRLMSPKSPYVALTVPSTPRRQVDESIIYFNGYHTPLANGVSHRIIITYAQIIINGLIKLLVKNPNEIDIQLAPLSAASDNSVLVKNINIDPLTIQLINKHLIPLQSSLTIPPINYHSLTILSRALEDLWSTHLQKHVQKQM